MKGLLVIVGSFMLCFALYHQVDGGASECYACNNTKCDEFKKVNCSEDFPNVNGSFVCATTEINGTTLKGCAADTNETKAWCDVLQKGNETSCSTCSEDLCNSAAIYSISIVLLASLIFFSMKI